MQFKHTVASSLALVILSAWGGQAMAAAEPASLSDKGLEIRNPLKLDAQRLMGMRAGEKVAIDFPVIGRKLVVFEATTKGLDGIRYWHGSIQGSPSDRVYLKQAQSGFVGAIRFAGRQVAFKQQADRTLAALRTVGPVAGQAYNLGASAEKGIVNIDGQFAALTQAEVGAEIALPLPNGQVEVAIVTKSEMDQDGFVQVQGVSRMDGVGSPSVITIGKDAVFGTVISNGSEYQIVTRQGKTQLIDPKAAGWAQLRGHDQAELVDEPVTQAALVAGAVTANALVTTAKVAAAPVMPVPLAAGKIDTTITLLMAYSPTYVSLWGTEAVARTRLSNIVQVANSAYSNSGTGIAFRIVGWSLVKQPDTTPQVNLAAMRADSGNFKGLAALRKSTGAAISVFFAPFNSVTGSTNTCGLAYVPAAGAAGLAAYGSQVATQNLLFTALNDGQSGNSYCETLSMAHELGHNLGNAHDKANSSFPGAFSYSYGKGVSGTFGTVMSYISPRVALFSSPQLTCTSTKAACGTDTENVVATMLQTKAYAAAQGVSSKVSAASEGFNIVSGWLTNTNGTPYTGAATVKPTNTAITCATGTTGLYVCKVPSALTSVELSVTATGKTVTPAVGSFTINAQANTPVNGTRFYLK
jgi:Metallo-peptidase family M12B Reprolysin-like